MVIETGLSDSNKLCVTVMKVYHSKQKPTIIHYHKLKNFENEAFIKDIKELLSKLFYGEIVPFETLRKSVSVIAELIRDPKWPYMSKKLSKEVIKRSRQKNKFLITRIYFSLKHF